MLNLHFSRQNSPTVSFRLFLKERIIPFVFSVFSLVKTILSEGDIGFFGFAVLVTFEIGFSVFALKIPGFSVLVSTAVFGFFPF